MCRVQKNVFVFSLIFGHFRPFFAQMGDHHARRDHPVVSDRCTGRFCQAFLCVHKIVIFYVQGPVPVSLEILEIYFKIVCLGFAKLAP